MTTSQKIEELLSPLKSQVESLERYGSILLDASGNILTWSQELEKIKGYKAEEIIGQHFGIFFLPLDRQAGVPEKLLKDAKKSGHASYLGRRIRKNGSIFWGKVEMNTIKEESGKLIGFSKFTRELSDESALGLFWFDNDGILHTKASPRVHSPEAIAQFRSVFSTILNGQKVCCIADLRDALLTKEGQEFAKTSIGNIYKAIAFVSDKKIDDNTLMASESISSLVPTEVFLNREEARAWIKQFLDKDAVN
jgi:PAS domain S-box-containing protein